MQFAFAIMQQSQDIASGYCRIQEIDLLEEAYHDSVSWSLIIFY